MVGVAAVLHKPMRGKPAMFGEPGPVPCMEGAPIVYREMRAGEVQALWVQDDLVHWIGVLDVEPPAAALPPERLSVAVESHARDLIGDGRLVGVPALTGARTRREDGCMVLEGWTVSRMELLTLDAAPWPELELTLR